MGLFLLSTQQAVEDVVLDFSGGGGGGSADLLGSLVMEIVSKYARPVMASEAITVSSTPIGLTAAKRSKQIGNGPSDRLSANSALISVEDASIRVNVDPAVTVAADANGHEMTVGAQFYVHGPSQLNDLRMIALDGDAIVRVTYFA